MKKTFILSALLATSILMSSLCVCASTVTTNKIPGTTSKQTVYQGPERRTAPQCPQCMCEKHKQKMKEMHEARKKEFETRLNLTEEQKQKAKEIRMKGHEQIKPIFEEMKIKKHQLMEFKQKEKNTLIEKAKIRQLENELKVLKEKAKSIRNSNKNEFEKILTQSQKEELKKMKQEGEKRYNEMKNSLKNPHRPPMGCPVDEK